MAIKDTILILNQATVGCWAVLAVREQPEAAGAGSDAT